MGRAGALQEGANMGDGNGEWSDETSPQEVVEAFKRGDHTGVGRLLEALRQDLESTGRLIDAKAAKKVLAALRNYVWFDQLKLMAETFERFAQDDQQVLLHLAQARIELGEITKAVGGLLKLKARIDRDLAEEGLGRLRRESLEYLLGEAIGLLGRCYKQYYVNAKPSSVEPRAKDLETSLAYYGDAYTRGLGDYCWHGINSVALLTHEKRVAEDKFNALSDEAKGRAREILDHIDDKQTAGKTLQPWDLANQIEANLAIGNTGESIKSTETYLDHSDIDAFAVQSTRRQLIEIWLLTEDRPPGNVILPMMNARFAELGGTPAVIEIDPGKAAHYERVYGTTKYKSLRWLQQAFSRAMSVARIGPSKFEGDGTGFLFDGAWISDAWAGKPLLLTNAHVCSNDPVVQEQIPYPSPPEALTAAFLGSGSASEAEELEFEELLWTSAPADLDATLLLLKDKPPEGCVPPPKTTLKPPVTLKGDARLNILGHPKGLDLRISLQDNKTVEVGAKYVHYQTPTDPGSSGSPVFNQKWELVALHHASSREKRANEGIRIDVIIDAIQQALTKAGG